MTRLVSPGIGAGHYNGCGVNSDFNQQGHVQRSGRNYYVFQRAFDDGRDRVHLAIFNRQKVGAGHLACFGCSLSCGRSNKHEQQGLRITAFILSKRKLCV
jgi:hypothetical protein